MLPTSAPIVAPTALLWCDIVMKGGVTSGVVYPGAICQIAKTYRYKNIGGTSAGAIAAALTAAAEYSRRSGGSGFDLLQQLPSYLSTGKNLVNLFQPAATTAPLFNALLGASKTNQSFLQRVFPLFTNCAGWALVGALVAAVLAAPILVGLWDNAGIFVYNLIPLGLFLILGAAVGVGWRMLQIVRTSIPENFFGMCSGHDRYGGKGPPLTDWLAAQIDTYARSGLASPPTGPLTMGMLWNDPAAAIPAPSIPGLAENKHLENDVKHGERDINLEMMTTNVTQGRPYRLPFSELEQTVFYFDKAEMGCLFPPDIVEHLVQKSDRAFTVQVAKPQAGDAPGTRREVLPLPPAAEFPVIMAARMSLSFPVLFSAIPLYAVDRSEAAKPDARVEKCWFSDGGISSNMPIQFFDGPLPRWPTFALNLRGQQPDDLKAPPVAMATDTKPDINVIPDTGTSRLPKFLSAVMDSMQNWSDNTQMALQGYRDRVVDIQLTPTQGGLNLEMPQAVLDSLKALGDTAGATIVNAFDPSTLRWDGHRKIRMRSALAMADEWLRHYVGGANGVRLPDAPYPVVLGTEIPWSGAAQQGAAQSLFDALYDAGGALETLLPTDSPSAGAPLPGPELRGRPRT